MASFNSGYYSNGGYQFDTTESVRRDPNDNSGVMYDDRSYDAPPQTAQQRPIRRDIGIGSSQPYGGRRAELDRVEFDDDLPEDFDDYRPGARLMNNNLTAGYQDFEPEDDFFDDDDFGDSTGFEDDFDDPADGRGRDSARVGSRMGYSRYDDDYTEADAASEFSGIHGIGSGRRSQQRQQPGVRSGAPERRDNRSRRDQYRDQYDDYNDYDADDADGYYGRATIRDKAYEGNGVPKIFADYFRDDDYDNDYYDDRPRRRPRPDDRGRSLSNGRNRSSNSHNVKQKRILTTTLAVVGVVAALGAVIGWLSVFRSSSPLNVATALTSMESSVSNQLLKASVDDTLSEKKFQIEIEGMTSTLSLSACEFQFSTEPDGKQERVYGKTVTGSDVEYTYTTRGSVKFNETKLKDFLHEAAGSKGIRMIDPRYDVKIIQDRDTKIYTGTLNIKAGTNGFGVNFDHFMDVLLQKIATDDSTPIVAQLENTIAPAVDVEKIYKEVYAEPVDAFKTTDGTGKVTYAEETIGVNFDKAAAAQKVAAGGTEWSISLALSIPKVSKRALMADTFPDLLSTYTTAFNAGNQARSNNLALAGDYINGLIMQPGDIFSFNDTVGERTKERGFCKATVYSSEGTDEDYGGGICQTSSTLFYAAMKANLKLEKRSNHMYTVAYMTDDNGKQCFGNDATVSWGTYDMKFSNNKEFPIKLECITKDGTITFNIWGTWDGYTAEYRYVEKATESHQLIYRKYKPDKKNQAGQMGRTIWTYRVVFYQEKQGVGEREEVDRYRDFESVYRPLTQVKFVTESQLPAGRQYDVAY